MRPSFCYTLPRTRLSPILANSVDITMTTKISRILGFCLILTAGCTLLIAQTEPKFDFYARGPYRENVPRPQSILRFDVGDHHTTYAQMEQVIDAIAKAAPDRVKILGMGTTDEHRMKHLVGISASENIARLEEVKAPNTRLSDTRTPRAGDDAALAQN